VLNHSAVLVGFRRVETETKVEIKAFIQVLTKGIKISLNIMPFYW